MTKPRLHHLIAITLLGASFLLGGCENTPGYEDKAPPQGAPKQSAEVPPGERGHSIPTGHSSTPSASH